MSTNRSKIRAMYDIRNYRNTYKPPKITKYTQDIQEALQTRKYKDVTGKCAGPLKGMHYADVISCFVPIREMYKTFQKEDKFKEWIQFINDLGFPCSYMGISPTVKFRDSKTFVVNIYPRDYPSKGKHLLACHTLIRYSYSNKYKPISLHTLNLFNQFGLNRWKCLYLGHYAQLNNSKYRGYYGLLPDEDVKDGATEFTFPPDEVGVKEWLCDKSINNSFTNTIKKKLPKGIGPLRKKNYKKYIEHLKL